MIQGKIVRFHSQNFLERTALTLQQEEVVTTVGAADREITPQKFSEIFQPLGIFREIPPQWQRKEIFFSPMIM